MLKKLLFFTFLCVAIGSVSPQAISELLVPSERIISAGREVNFVNYAGEQGFPFPEVLRSYEDSKGYLWICTKDGLSRFDGINFKNYSEKDGLPTIVVTGAAEDNNGQMWFCTIKGFAVLKNNKFDTALKLPKARYMRLFKDKDGTMWAAHGKGIVHFDPLKSEKHFIEEFNITEKVENTGVRNIWRNKNGELLIGAESGVYVLKNKKLVRYKNHPLAVYDVIEHDNGTEWIIGWNQPVSVYRNGVLERKIDLGGGVLDYKRDKKGNIWLATWDKGIYKYDGKNFIHYTAKEGLSFNSFWGVTIDSRGNLWFSSWGNGIYKYSGESFTRISEKYGLPGNISMGITEASDGKIWIASDQSVSSYDPATGEIKSFTECDGKTLSLVNTVFEYKPGEIWAPGYIGVGYKIIDGKIVSEKDFTGFDIVRTKGDNIMIATDLYGVQQISGKDKKYIKVNDVKDGDRVIDIYEDKKKNLWFINEFKGIHLYKNYTVKYFGKENGFFDEYAISMAQDDNGYYWIAVNRRGIYKCVIKNEEDLVVVDSITTRDGLISDNIRSVHVFHEKLYLGTKDGLAVMELEYIEKGRKEIFYFNKEDGLLTADCKILLIDKKGNIWLSTPKGVYCYNPLETKKNTQEPKTYITDLKLFFEKTDWKKFADEMDDNDLPKNLTLPYQQNHLTFNFIGINLVAPGKVLYQYKLEGQDEKWSPARDKREITYSGLAPGSYTFMVKSCNNDGVWNKQPATFAFTISPPFWKTTWFYISCIVLIGALIYFFIKYREKKLQKEKDLLEDKINERTSELKYALGQIEESINYASKIQTALLPSKQDIEQLTYDYFVFFRPKDIVSGDFYWCERRESRTYLALCDSTGHGVPGAFMSLLNINFINEAINEKNIEEPNEIFNSVRMELVDRISREGQKDGFDGVLICFDKKDNSLTYAAANNKPILISNGVVTNLPVDKMPVGKGEKEDSFRLREIQYKKGDSLYLFSDGFADQFGGPNGKKFKNKQLEELLLSVHHLPMKEQLALITKAFEDWKGKLDQVDDVCVIGIRLF
ncbi:MAG: Response regulator containing a CheY-like receiver domain and a domain protein [Bacteroidetes bacterium]|jgi:ligand-binding sensor domain-containing protein/serine phosphatase RsbU (regulator of sigma subunit)|nr:Response regulator containing a CheY-like receiver domain and a domain protein [Bacteroidota bacterium]